MLTGDLLAERYRLLRRLGHGGMGVVWAARNEAIQRDVAIKVMLPRIAEDPVALQRFFNEARICGSIRHPGIVDVLDLGRAEDGSPFLVMELLDGETLSERLERLKRLSIEESLRIARDIARTIAMAHKRGIIHRDLKPSNIFLHRSATGEEIVKVLDFGISKVLAPEFETKTTRTGAVLGSPAYMSPERAKGDEELYPYTDVYSLGVILYETLAGRMPYLSENYNALIVDIVTTDPDDIATLVPDLPPAVAALVRDAMARDTRRRIQTMDELADRVEHILFGGPVDPRFSITGSTGAPGSRISRTSFPGGPVSAIPSSPMVKTGSGVTTSHELAFEAPRRRIRIVMAGLGLGVGVLIAVIILMSMGGPSPAPAGSPEASQSALAPTAVQTAAPTAAIPSSAPSADSTAGQLAASAVATAPASKGTSGSKAPPVKTGKPPGGAPTTPTKPPGGAWGYD